MYVRYNFGLKENEGARVSSLVKWKAYQTTPLQRSGSNRHSLGR
jgi:hypothetical protein